VLLDLPGEVVSVGVEVKHGDRPSAAAAMPCKTP
jgi:ABC-type transport system substrate-binding protein